METLDETCAFRETTWSRAGVRTHSQCDLVVPPRVDHCDEIVHSLSVYYVGYGRTGRSAHTLENATLLVCVMTISVQCCSTNLLCMNEM